MPSRSSRKKRDIKSLSRTEIRRIYLDRIGFVPEAVMRDFVRLATGDVQPEKYPVSVLSASAQFLIYGRDEQAGTLTFMPLQHALRDAVAACSISRAGTWGRFRKLEPYRCRQMQSGLAYGIPFKTFAIFNRCRGAGRPRVDVMREYNRLDWRDMRPPHGRDPISLELVWEFAAEWRLDMHDPRSEMAETLPLWIRWKYGGVSRRPRLRDLPPVFPLRHEAVILAGLRNLGFTVLAEQLLVDCFHGREVDRDSVVARVRSYESLARKLWHISAADAIRQERELARKAWQ